MSNLNLNYTEKAKELLSKMTIDEKLDQITICPLKAFKPMTADAISAGNLSTRFGTFGNIDHLNDEDGIDKIQDFFVNQTRLGIPAAISYDSLHGILNSKGTVFPQSSALGGTFDRELIYNMAQVIGKECRGLGVRLVYAPNVDVPHDARWGRSQEAYSEDPYLVGEMGVNYVKGVQENGVAATAKHYIAYGANEGGLNLAPAHVGEREVREVMLEPFKKCVDAGVMAVMPSYNEIDGVPVHASKKYLKDILRNELGFEGAIISDGGAIDMLYYFHHTSPNRLAAAKICLESGIDIDLAGNDYGFGDEFREAAKNGEIDMQLIDNAVLRALELKFKLNLFENPYTDKELKKEMNNDYAKSIALKADEESILLLKNDGILPLDENKVGKVAIIGNNAKDSFIGNYIDRTESCIDFYSGMVNRLGEENILYSRGCGHITCTDEMITDAVETAKKADTVFLVLGDSTDTGGGVAGGKFKDSEITCGEAYDSERLCLSPSQQKLFDEISALNKPTVLIYYAGRPCAIMEDVKKVNGFMLCFGAGEQNGIAFANLIFGDKTPSAKLSFSLPRSVGHLPCYYNHKISARGSFYRKPGTPESSGRDYVYSSPEAWLPFGFGLSYTTLEYSNLSAEVKDDNTVKVSVDLENKGDYEINESVLLFVKTLFCPITPFVKRLRAFDKVNIKSGEKKKVCFTLTRDDFTYIDEDYNTAYATGVQKIMVENLECEIIL